MDWFDQLCIFKASNRQRETQTRQVLPSYVIVYLPSYFPCSTGSKQFLPMLREEDYTEAWSPEGEIMEAILKAVHQSAILFQLSKC